MLVNTYDSYGSWLVKNLKDYDERAFIFSRSRQFDRNPTNRVPSQQPRGGKEICLTVSYILL